MALYKRRKRLREMTEAEARGESFWTPEFERSVRIKIHRIADDCTSLAGGYFDSVAELARDQLLDDDGETSLTGDGNALRDFWNFFLKCDEDDFASAVEALVNIFPETVNANYSYHHPLKVFIDRTNVVFAEHRVSWEIVEKEMIPFDSKEMHTAVVAPVLRLLSGLSGWDDVEKAYQDALERLSKRESADAITDAARSLEATLGQLGFDGKTLGERVKPAKSAGAIRPEDGKLFEWVAAARGNLSDSHAGEQGDYSEAWLVVHVVGALILRLVAGA